MHSGAVSRGSRCVKTVENPTTARSSLTLRRERDAVKSHRNFPVDQVLRVKEWPFGCSSIVAMDGRDF